MYCDLGMELLLLEIHSDFGGDETFPLQLEFDVAVLFVCLFVDIIHVFLCI